MISSLHLFINLKARHNQHYCHLYILIFILTEESSSVELMKTLATGFLCSISPKKRQHCMTSQSKGLPSFSSPSKESSFPHSLCLWVLSSQCLIYFNSFFLKNFFRFYTIPVSSGFLQQKRPVRGCMV